jgi:hypothetical protein
LILGTSEPNYSLADLNNDEIVNIQDLIILVNMVIGGRTIQSEDNIGVNAIIYENGTTAFLSADGNIAGIQMTVKTNNLHVNENLPLSVETNYIGDQYIILIYGSNGETLSGDKVQLFTASEDYEITSILVANVLSQIMNIDRIDRLLPEVFELSQNFPNPFNPNTQIQFTLGKDEFVNLNIFDIQGRLVKSLVNNSYYPTGYYNINWNGKNNMGIQVPSGMYIYKLVSENQTLTRKMVFMK